MENFLEAAKHLKTTTNIVALADYFKALPDADRKVETAAFKLTRPYYAKDQKCDRVAWQAFADFALKHGLIERQVDVAALLPELSEAE